MHKRRFAAAATVLTAGLLLSACSASGTSTEPAASVVPELTKDQQVSIVFESYNLTQAGPWADTVNQLLAEFQAKHPNIQVKAQPPQGGGVEKATSSVQTQLLAGNAPDVVQLGFGSRDYAAQQLGAHAFEDIVGTQALQEQFAGDSPYHERARQLGDVDGKTYGMPYVFSTPMLYVNSTMLENAGADKIDLSTWDGVQQAAELVTASTGKPSLDVACFYQTGEWCLQSLIRSNGGEVISTDRKTIEFGAKQAAGAVERFAEMFQDGVLRNADAAAQNEGLAKGEVAFLLQSSAIQGSLVKASAAAGWQLTAAPLPAFEGHEAVPVNSGSALYVMSNDPAKQRASWELISFLTNAQSFATITQKIGYLPLRTGLVEPGGELHAWAEKNPLVKPNLEQLDRMEPSRAYPGNDYSQISSLLVKGAEEVVYYGKPATETMQGAAARAQDLIK